MIKSALSNRSVNFLVLHFGLQMFANGIGDLFVGIYLLQRGIPLWMIFAVWGSSFTARLFLRPLFLELCWKFSLRHILMWGTFAYSLLFLVLNQITGINIWLGIYIIASAIIDNSYWLPYHTYFCILGDIKHRGKQIALRETVNFLGAFLSPLLGALLITSYGFQTTFFAGTIVMLLAIPPLLFTPDIRLERKFFFREAFKKIEKEGFWFYLGEALLGQGYGFTWKLVLFIFVGEYLAFGGLMSLAVLFQIFGVLTIGHLFDQGRGRTLSVLGILLTGLIIIGRIFFTNSIPLIIFMDIIAMIGFLLYSPGAASAFYNAAKNSSHPLWFQFFAESGWDVGSIIVSFLAAVFLYFGGDLRFVMLIGPFGLMVMHHILSSKLLRRNE